MKYRYRHWVEGLEAEAERYAGGEDLERLLVFTGATASLETSKYLALAVGEEIVVVAVGGYIVKGKDGVYGVPKEMFEESWEIIEA